MVLCFIEQAKRTLKAQKLQEELASGKLVDQTVGFSHQMTLPLQYPNMFYHLLMHHSLMPHMPHTYYNWKANQ